MPALKKRIPRLSMFMIAVALVLAGVSLLSPPSDSKVYAGQSCSPGYHMIQGNCAETNETHPVKKSDLSCQSSQTPTKITSGPNNGKWYCKGKPQQGVGPAQAQGSPKQTTPCNLNSGCDLIDTYVNPLINFLSIAFGLIAVISLIMGGIQYSASEGDPQKSAQAKKRIYDTLIAVFAYLFLYTFLQFLIPGGLFH